LIFECAACSDYIQSGAFLSNGKENFFKAEPNDDNPKLNNPKDKTIFFKGETNNIKGKSNGFKRASILFKGRTNCSKGKSNDFNKYTSPSIPLRLQEP
jgi:hypothetical protein